MNIPLRFAGHAALIGWPSECPSGLRVANIIFIPNVICRFRIQPLFDQMLGAHRYVRELQTATFSGFIHPYNLTRAFDELAHSWKLELKAYELALTQVLDSLKSYATLAGILMDASEGGVRFQGVQHLRKSQLVCIKFEFPGMREFIEGTGQIVWVDKSGKGGGLQFTDVSVRTQHLIKQWLDSETAYNVRNEDDVCHSESAGAFAGPANQGGVPGETKRNVHEQEPDESVSEGALPSADSNRTSRYSDHNSRARSSSTWSMKKVLTILVVFGVVVTVGARLFQMHRSEVLRKSPVSGEVLQANLVGPELPSGPFWDLKVEPSGQDLQVEWHQNADVPDSAVRGLLTITDGSSRLERDLDPTELRIGKNLYTPVTAH